VDFVRDLVPKVSRRRLIASAHDPQTPDYVMLLVNWATIQGCTLRAPGFSTASGFEST
jgi:hypothetical protein